MCRHPAITTYRIVGDVCISDPVNRFRRLRRGHLLSPGYHYHTVYVPHPRDSNASKFSILQIFVSIPFFLRPSYFILPPDLIQGTIYSLTRALILERVEIGSGRGGEVLYYCCSVYVFPFQRCRLPEACWSTRTTLATECEDTTTPPTHHTPRRFWSTRRSCTRSFRGRCLTWPWL